MKIGSICIIGLGLIGSSIARAIRAKTDIKTVCGIDVCEETVKTALKDGIITCGGSSLKALLRSADIVFICTPADAAIEWVKQIAPILGQNAVICDTASTKAEIVSEVEKIPGAFKFVGGHPMAGAENSGYAFGRAHLFENAYFVLTPCGKSDDNSINALSEFVSLLGAIPIVTDPKAHDRATGLVSHLPHVAAAALANLLGDLDDSARLNFRLAAGGFRDLTRIASSPPELWTGIAMANSKELEALIDAYVEVLSGVKNKLEKGDGESLRRFFERGRAVRDSLSERLNSLIPKTYELYVDVEDRPGMISTVASIISGAGINIKNINISNNRSEPGGVMLVSLEDEAGVSKALEILTKEGISCKIKDG